MPSSPIAPRLVKGGIVLLDPASGSVKTIIVLQYNPDSLTRSLQAQAVGDSQDRSQALRLKGPPVETVKIEAEIDAADQLELPGQNALVVQYGIFPQLAVLETIVYPTSEDLQANNTLAQRGTLEIAPVESPLTLFVWGQNRILPVRLTDFSITEEAFDVALNPIRAKVSLGLRVLTVNDLGFDHKGGNLFMTYLQQKERLARLNLSGSFGALGIGGIP